MTKLTKKEKDAAIRFLGLIECSVGLHVQSFGNDEGAKEFDKAEIDGFNACCKMLGVAGHNNFKWWEK